MSGVTDPLDIAFYDADGSRNSGRVMEPCPEKAETECPVVPRRRALRVRARDA